MGAFVCFCGGTPANKAALEKHYDTFLDKSLARCTTCHLPSANKNPEILDEFPHNAFGSRLRAVGKELAAAGKPKDLPSRLKSVAREDSDGDGTANETELLLGRNPGDSADAPDRKDLATAKKVQRDFEAMLASYRWQPFEPVKRPVPPKLSRGDRNPIDAFVAAERKSRGLKPVGEASKQILLRRVYLDLIGLSPMPEELAAFENDKSPDAYERVVDRLLADPRHGERWGRHWMDVWRYSDWAGWSGGNQIRDSKPHIWRWRDWIVESLNGDKPYARMLSEMLAGDEIAPEDTNTLRATGFLVRNYKMLSREQWLEDTVKHTSQAFMGVTVGCAKCHDHMTDPISQAEYYGLRAVFEPHWVRTDRLPGDTNVMNLGLARTFDVDTNSPTYFFNRGDERKPDTNRVLAPSVPAALGGMLEIKQVALPAAAAFPDNREFVIRDTIAASEKIVEEARKSAGAATKPGDEKKLKLLHAEAQHEALLAVIAAEKELANSGKTDAWQKLATNAFKLQRRVAVADAKLKLEQARRASQEAAEKADKAAEKLAAATNGVQQVALNAKDSPEKLKEASDKAAKSAAEAVKKLQDSEKALSEAEEKFKCAAESSYKPRGVETYPTNSTGRRLAFAQWLTRTDHPLVARVAVNQIWMRHFGQGIVATPHDFGRAGKPPSHPQLLDWLASEFMARGWSMKHMHKLIVMSSTYRLASVSDAANSRVDPDNIYLWRMNSRRMEAEVVRDNLLLISGEMDPTFGGPDIDHMQGLKSKRRSIYLRLAAEKEVEFLKIFDGPSVTECYTRRPSVVPQQALALGNSELTVSVAKALARKLSSTHGTGVETFARSAFETILARHPKPDELKLCREFLDREESQSQERARERLISVLFNHNDFVTIR